MRRMVPQKDIEKLDCIKLLQDGTYTSINNNVISIVTPKGSLRLGGEEYTTLYSDASVTIGGDYSPEIGDYNYVLNIGADGFQFQHLNEDSEELENFVTFNQDLCSINASQVATLTSGTATVNAGTSNQKSYATMEFFDEDASDTGAEIRVDDQGVKIDPDFAAVGTRYLILYDIPTSDPGVEGAVWNDNGTLKISAGE